MYKDTEPCREDVAVGSDSNGRLGAIYMMTNRELSAAIDRTHHLLKNTGSSNEYFKDNITHLKALLEIERTRASQVRVDA